MKIKVMLIITFCGSLIQPAYSITMNGCGDYLVEGFVRKIQKSAVLIINETSVSEIKIKAPFNWETKLQAYVDKPVKAQIKIKKKFNGTNGELHSIKTIEMRVPDPIGQNFDKIKLLKKAECL